MQHQTVRAKSRKALSVQQKWLVNNRLKLLFCVHPCPCAYRGDSEQNCTCSASVVARYQKRISGPLLDHFDIQVEVAYQ